LALSRRRSAAAAGGRVRAVEGVRHPTRLDTALAADLLGRCAPRAVADDDLLAPDLRGWRRCSWSRARRRRRT
jgi:hypothetical protein